MFMNELLAHRRVMMLGMLVFTTTCFLPSIASEAPDIVSDVPVANQGKLRKNAKVDVPEVSAPVPEVTAPAPEKPRTFGYWWSLHGSADAGLNAGIVFGICVATIILFIFVIEALRGHSKKDLYTNAVTWGIFLIVTAAGHVQSPGDDPSIYITVGASMELLAIIILVSSSMRFPIEFGILMVVTLAVRVGVTSTFQGYLPVDQTGDGCIQIIEAMTLLTLLYGLRRQMRMPGYKSSYKITAIRLGMAFLVCTLLSLICFGDLDLTRDFGSRPDREYAACLYMELIAWFFMLHFQIYVYPQNSSTWLLPAVIQAVCRSYYWCLAYKWGLTAPREPILMQRFFPLAAVIVHLSMSAILTLMAALSSMDMSKSILDKEDCKSMV
jgi:hypothetical protein